MSGILRKTYHFIETSEKLQVLCAGEVDEVYVRHGPASAGCGERGAGVRGCRAGTPVCDLIPNAAGSRERDVGMVSPTAPSRLLWGQHRHLGAGSRAQQPLCICEILCSSSARGGEWVSPFNSITKQIQDPASWASSILIGISTRTPAPAEHFYRTENKFSNEPEWLNQETVGRDLYIEHTGIPNQIKQPKHVSPAPCYLNAMSTFRGGSANCTWFCSEKFGFRALIRLMWRERRILAPQANVIHCRLQHASSHPSLLLHFIVFFPPIKTLRPMALFCSVLCIHWSNQGRSGAS